MYIKKSIISNIIMVTGGVILAIITLLYCFTECGIPTALLAGAWLICIVGVVTGVEYVELL